MLVLGYVILFSTALLSGGFLFWFEQKPKALKYFSIFGSAFLMAVCFVHLLPEAFGHSDISCGHLHEYSAHCEHSFSFPLGAFVLIGFLLQLILELLSKGAEHGHRHDDTQTQSHETFSSALMVLLGVCLHAFLEGFALAPNGEMNYSLLIGIVLHNIPISMVVVSGFLKAGCSKPVSIAWLAVFASAGVLGSLLGVHLEALQAYTAQIMCFVVGILLHVSLSTLFDSTESHQYNFVRFAIVVAAFALAVLLAH